VELTGTSVTPLESAVPTADSPEALEMSVATVGALAVDADSTSADSNVASNWGTKDTGLSVPTVRAIDVVDEAPDRQVADTSLQVVPERTASSGSEGMALSGASAPRWTASAATSRQAVDPGTAKLGDVIASGGLVLN